jgi:Tfp pilus assembly protein PilF
MTEAYLHRSAYQKWQKGGRSDLTDAEFLVLERHSFRPPGDSGDCEQHASISDVVSMDPAIRVDSLLRAARLLQDAGHLTEAENQLRTIVSHVPRSSNVLQFFALFLQFDVRNNDEAEFYFRRAAIFNPRSVEIFSHIGLLEHLKGEDSKAEANYRKALLMNCEGPLPRCAHALSSLPFARSEAYVILGALMEDR